ncbi:MAG: type II toxin-antitoxin system VapC family toxin [Candidatus Hydrogenedentes bacterium]|nr:type II toxin-antitoxin system VapC family toxin [Candidatus Hydrogenedentota bacterium]
MSLVFVDTSFYQALLNPRDQWHGIAVAFSREFRGNTVTSEYVLCELGALMSPPHLRRVFVEFVGALASSHLVEVSAASPESFQAGLELFADRLDKEWSLTDCVSFAMMKQRGIVETLSFDHHFEQAGFGLLPGRR